VLVTLFWMTVALGLLSGYALGRLRRPGRMKPPERTLVVSAGWLLAGLWIGLAAFLLAWAVLRTIRS
jgi:hypothetical protein